MMQFTCSNCGSDTFKAGELELDPAGGFVVKMPCADCGTPVTLPGGEDPEFAQMITEFFRSAP